MKWPLVLIPAILGLAPAAMAQASPLAQLVDPPPHQNLTFVEPTEFDIRWTATTSGSPLDHTATLIASQTQIQTALGLGGAPPSSTDIQTYFGGQAPVFAGWTIHAPGDTTMHVSGVTPGQVYFLAVTAVDQAGGYDGVFTLSRNVARIKPSTELQPPMVDITSPEPDSVHTPVVTAALT